MEPRTSFTVLVVHCDTGRSEVKANWSVDELVGGSGLAAGLFAAYARPDAPWDHPDQPLIFAIGPLTNLALALRNALLYREVKSMADHDGLTKIANRRRFEERLDEEAQRHGRYELPLSLILFDLDHFKNVNDTFGHQTGDAVLRGMAGLLLESLRGSDLPARFGGEEFAVILPHTSREQALLLAERIRQRVAGRDFGELDQKVRLTVSAGVAALEPGASSQELVSLADQALYLAKNGGRNRVVVAAPEAGAQNLRETGDGPETEVFAGADVAAAQPRRVAGGI